MLYSTTGYGPGSGNEGTRRTCTESGQARDSITARSSCRLLAIQTNRTEPQGKLGGKKGLTLILRTANQTPAAVAHWVGQDGEDARFNGTDSGVLHLPVCSRVLPSTVSAVLQGTFCIQYAETCSVHDETFQSKGTVTITGHTKPVLTGVSIRSAGLPTAETKSRWRRGTRTLPPRSRWSWWLCPRTGTNP